MSAALPRPDIQAFARTFFTYFGAQITAHPDEWTVDLPPRLADHFGKDRLYLVFPRTEGQARELSPHEDLLVYGSRTLDRMLALLDGQGETARLEFPRQITVAIEPAPGPSLRQPRFRVIETAVERQNRWLQLFNFRVIYSSDEKEEAVESIVLDEAGQRLPNIEARLPQLAPLPKAPTLPSPLESAKPHLDEATTTVRQQVEARVADLNQQTRARLQKTIRRLTSFYRRLIAEIDSDNPEQDAALKGELEQELQRKINDELDRHRLQVSITPVSQASALLPSVKYNLAITAAPVIAQTGGTVHQAVPGDGPPLTMFGKLESHGRKPADYHWQQIITNDYAIYIGHHWLRGTALLALDYSGKILQWQQRGWLG